MRYPFSLLAFHHATPSVPSSSNKPTLAPPPLLHSAEIEYFPTAGFQPSSYHPFVENSDHNPFCLTERHLPPNNSLLHLLPPDIYVSSPEEDGEPPYSYCVFKASWLSTPSSSIDIAKLSAALKVLEKLTEDTPVFKRDKKRPLEELVVMPRKRDSTMASDTSILIGLESIEGPITSDCAQPTKVKCQTTRSLVQSIRHKASVVFGSTKRPRLNPAVLDPDLTYNAVAIEGLESSTTVNYQIGHTTPLKTYNPFTSPDDVVEQPPLVDTCWKRSSTPFEIPSVRHFLKGRNLTWKMKGKRPPQKSGHDSPALDTCHQALNGSSTQSPPWDTRVSTATISESVAYSAPCDELQGAMGACSTREPLHKSQYSLPVDHPLPNPSPEQHPTLHFHPQAVEQTGTRQRGVSFYQVPLAVDDQESVLPMPPSHSSFLSTISFDSPAANPLPTPEKQKIPEYRNPPTAQRLKNKSGPPPSPVVDFSSQPAHLSSCPPPESATMPPLYRGALLSKFSTFKPRRHRKCPEDLASHIIENHLSSTALDSHSPPQTDIAKQALFRLDSLHFDKVYFDLGLPQL